MKNFACRTALLTVLTINLLTAAFAQSTSSASIDSIYRGFLAPPASARPGVYWYFMDGNLSREAITEDLESMRKAGIGHVVFLEVNVGVPRGKVDFLSDQWQEMFRHAVRESERLGITITLGVGPGWTGSGGPWVKGSQSMQHLVSTTVDVSHGQGGNIKLAQPKPRQPYFGEEGFTPDARKKWEEYYQDVAVLAFPTPSRADSIRNTDEKAIYYREPYSSKAGVAPYLSTGVAYPKFDRRSVIDKKSVIDITRYMHRDGTLSWTVPAGKWTIMRFGSTNNGAVTRPAPLPGVGLESDKFDTAALDAHLAEYTGKIFAKIGEPDSSKEGGLKVLHMDSWEMGAQNWTRNFRKEFIHRRGYDPLPFYPVYSGNIVGSPEISERFLWDLRQTGQELVIEYHAQHIKEYSHRHGLKISIEPYDMNPTSDLELGSVADIPMCEFWSRDYGIPTPHFTTAFSSMEASSIGHLNGQPLVRAEAFTSVSTEAMKQHPASMKDQGDWAFAAGINQFYFHTFVHQDLNDSLKPGMTMGPYGVHWDRNQTWWPMVTAYHQYLTRCGYLLQQGRTVADILYLMPEGAPQVFNAPTSALAGDYIMPDRKGYNFDGCAPGKLHTASVVDGRIVFPGGASYRLLILPNFHTMTPRLLRKIASLVKHGATIVGAPPLKSPGLTGYPLVDDSVRALSKTLWNTLQPMAGAKHRLGKGAVIVPAYPKAGDRDSLYPDYEFTKDLMQGIGVQEDFTSVAPLRYTHRTAPGWDIYFVSNKSDSTVVAPATFRAAGDARLWDPLTAEVTNLPASGKGGMSTFMLQLAPHGSLFIVFGSHQHGMPAVHYPVTVVSDTLHGSWTVNFDTAWGGPRTITLDTLTDWTHRSEAGIKYFSGKAVYKKTFDLARPVDTASGHHLYLDLGEVKNIAAVRLNGKDLGIVWTSPWRVDIKGAIKEKGNQLEVEVINLWANRLIGDEFLADDGIRGDQWPEWLTKGEKRPSPRYTFITYKFYQKNSPLLSSGLLGPVTVRYESN